jgi:hypothetical protein
LDRIEARGGRLVVSGYWSGVRGMRFMRPTLIVGDREVLATLDHKPWTPSDEIAWTAAFPWDDPAPDRSEVVLAVTPSLSVPLAADAAEPAAPAAPAAPEPPVAAAPAPEPAADPEQERLRSALADAARRREELERRLEQARRRADALEAERDAARLALTGAERERDHAIGQRDEAAADRDAAVRTRARMEAQLAEEAERRAEAERDREAARAQREEALLAHRALQRRLDGALASDGPAPVAHDGPASHAGHDDPDRPIGVRAIPAARAVGPDLHRAERSDTPHVSRYDVWAIRILGSIAALCFIGFLVLLLRLFL